MIWYYGQDPVQKNQECAVPLGIQGENQSLVYTADVSDWLALWPNGVVALVLQAPDKSEPYMGNTSLDRENGVVTWTITNFDTSIVGYGFGELRIVENDVVKKSYRFATYIRPSILASAAEPPAPIPDWINDLLEAADNIQEAVDAAEAAQAGAEAAQSAAETAAASALATKSDVDTLYTQTVTAKEAAVAAQTGATQSMEVAAQAKADAVLAKKAAVDAQDAAELAARNASMYKDNAYNAKNSAQAAQTAAETAQGKAETAQAAAETAQTGAETALASTLAAKDTAISAITAQQATSVSAVTAEGTTQKNAVQAKGQEVIASIPQDYTALSTEVGDLKSAFGEVAEYHAPTNLYNKNSALNRTNYMVQASGNYVSLNGAQASHPIKVELGKTYTFKYSAGWFGVSNNRIVRFCDAEGNLDTGSGRFWSATDNGTASGTFTVTEDVGYVCVNVRASDAGVMVFNEGSSLASYSDWFEPYYKIKESALPDDLPLPPNAQNNLLYGKKLAVTGDSICYGAGSSGGYAAIIGTDNNMTVSNIAVSGGTICSGTVNSGGGARFCISASVDNMPENYDYYIVEGGANDADASTGATLGTISSGYNATLDTTTMCGAMESLCKKLQTNFPGKKYGFIFPHNVYGDTSVWNTGWRTEMKKCLNKWGIPYLDLSDECAQLRNIDALRVYTSSSDGWHPTEDGYKLYYVPKIEAWLKTL